MDETVIGVIPTARIKTGLFSSKAYTLVFTDRRLILAEMTKQLLNAEIERSRAAAKARAAGSSPSGAPSSRPASRSARSTWPRTRRRSSPRHPATVR
ncbi:MAG: hypothetical protein ACYC65_03030 [Candidatus Limnocylindrales bacterium]